MIIAGRNTMYGKSSSGKPPWDWSFETAMKERTSLMSKYPKVYEMPSVVAEGSYPSLTNRSAVIPLTEFPGCIGVFYGDSTQHYKIIDPMTGDIVDTGTTVPKDQCLKCVVNMDGVVVIVTRTYGKVYRMNQDGSGLQQVGACTGHHFDTNDNFSMINEPDGSIIVFSCASSDNPRFRIGRDFSITNEGNMPTLSYPSRYIHMPNYRVVCQVQGYTRVYSEDWSSTLLSATYGSYFCNAHAFMTHPSTPDCVYFGMQQRSKTVGINLSTMSPITRSSDTKFGVDGEGCSVSLPTGQFFYYRNYGSGGSWFGLYDATNGEHIILNEKSISSNDYGGMMMLSDGKIATEYEKSGVFGMKVLDYGFSKIPLSLIYGPYGLNTNYGRNNV